MASDSRRKSLKTREDWIHLDALCPAPAGTKSICPSPHPSCPAAITYNRTTRTWAWDNRELMNRRKSKEFGPDAN